MDIASAGAEVSNLSLVSDNSNLNFKKIIKIKTHKTNEFPSQGKVDLLPVKESCVEREISKQQEPMSTVGRPVNAFIPQEGRGGGGTSDFK